MRVRRFFRAMFIILAVLSPGSGFGEDSLRSLVEAGAYRQAYDHAATQLDQRIGDPDFDFWYGLAAIEVGRFGEGALAMERVLIVWPQHHRARLELARAYFQQGDLLAARAEFITVRDQSPPQNVALRVKAFLEEIERRLKALRMQSRLFGRMGAGHDSNINSSTSDGSVEVPALGVVVLGDGSRAVEDQFSEWEAGGELTYRLSRQRALFASAAYKMRNDFRHDAFDTETLGVKLGPKLRFGGKEINLLAQFQQFNVDGSTLRRMFTLNSEWQRRVGRRSRYSWFGQVGTLRFPGQSVKDADLFTVGGNLVRQDGRGRRTSSLSLYYGDERATESLGKHHGRAYVGVRAGAQFVISHRTLAYLAAGYQFVEHDAEDVVFAKVRKDDFYSLTAGGAWRFRARLTLELELAALINDSNIALYEYDRTQVKGALSYVF